MDYLTTNNQLSWRDKCARQVILNQYKILGESTRSIERIQYEINTLSNCQYNISSLVPNYLERLLHVERTRSHHIVKIMNHDDYQIALHFIPSRYQIRGYLHRGLVNVVYVQQGELHIEQRSLSNQENTFHCEIKENQSCAGLLKLRNIHHLKTTVSPCIFLSFRIAKRPPNTHTVKKLFSLFASSTLLFLAGFNPQKSNASEQVLLYGSQHSMNNMSHKFPNKNVMRANQLRNGKKSEADLYNAAQLYRQEANKGNAEAQYWLGVMYLEGSGITEVSDEEPVN